MLGLLREQKSVLGEKFVVKILSIMENNRYYSGMMLEKFIKLEKYT